MIGFDTNVVVRLLVQDDPKQVRRAEALLADAEERSEPVVISDIVLSELEWVLESAYSVPRKRILVSLQRLASDGRFCFESAERVGRALDLYQHGSSDLADYLLGLRGEEIGARTTFTFDRGLRDDPRFTLLRG